MKKTLLSIALIGSAFAATSQILFKENFNSYAVGDLGTIIDESAPNQGNWFIYGTSTQKSEVYNISPNDNALKLTGSAAAGSRYVTQVIKSKWNKRTAGNDVLFVSFIFETPATQNTSRNSFEVNVPDSLTGFPLVGIAFDNLTNKLSGVFYDSLKTSPTATVGTKSAFSQKLSVVSGALADLTLANGKAYYVELMLNKTTGDTYWRGLDITGPSPVTVFNIYRTQVKKSSGVTGVELVARSGNSTATPNTASTTFNIDDILVKAKCSIDAPYPDFADIAPICSGSTLTLPTSSLDATPIVGTWSPAVSNTVSQTYTFTATSVCADFATMDITILDCAGIEENNVSSYSIFPNPANDFISVSFSDLAENNGTIRLLSADGKVIETRNYSNASVETFDVKSLNSGVYFFQIGNTTEKVFIK